MEYLCQHSLPWTSSLCRGHFLQFRKVPSNRETVHECLHRQPLVPLQGRHWALHWEPPWPMLKKLNLFTKGLYFEFGQRLAFEHIGYLPVQIAIVKTTCLHLKLLKYPQNSYFKLAFTIITGRWSQNQPIISIQTYFDIQRQQRKESYSFYKLIISIDKKMLSSSL